MREINHTAAEAAHRALQSGLQSRDLERAFFRTVASAVQPRDVSQRHCFDADLGSFNAHPGDPRTQPDEMVGNMLEQIACAEQALHMARRALQGTGAQISTVAARQQMTEARGFLAVPQ